MTKYKISLQRKQQLAQYCRSVYGSHWMFNKAVLCDQKAYTAVGMSTRTGRSHISKKLLRYQMKREQGKIAALKRENIARMTSDEGNCVEVSDEECHSVEGDRTVQDLPGLEDIVCKSEPALMQPNPNDDDDDNDVTVEFEPRSETPLAQRLDDEAQFKKIKEEVLAEVQQKIRNMVQEEVQREVAKAKEDIIAAIKAGFQRI